MHSKIKTIQAAASLDRTIYIAGVADVAFAAAGETKQPSVTMLAYNGGTLKIKGIPVRVVIDLATLRASANGVSLLFDHNPRELVGMAKSVKISATSIEAAGLITGDEATDASTKKILVNARNGFKWPVSVGVDPGTVEEIRAGAKVTVNGRTFTGPVLVARDGVLREISFVGVGADESASARIAASAAGAYSMTFEEWCKKKGFDHATLTDEQRTGLKASYDAEIAASADTEDETETDKGTASAPAATIQAGATTLQIRTEAANETKRIAGINAIAGISDKLKGEAIEAGWSVETTELKHLRDHRPHVNPAQPLRGDRATLTRAVITAALCLTAGLSEKFVGDQVPSAMREQVMNQAVSGEYRGASLHMLMDSTIRAAGHSFTGNRKDNAFIRAAFEANNVINAGGFTTLSLSGILADVAHKTLLSAYQAVEVVWPFICAIRNHSDFKAHNAYRLDSTGAFKKVAADGELKHIGLKDASFSNRLDTYGAIIALTRQMMINDDLGAFLSIPEFIGRMAAIRLEEAVFALLLANTGSFFHADNGNVLTGSGSALSFTSLTAMETQFVNRVDSNGKPILVPMNRILVPSNLKTTAENLYAEKLLITGENATITANNPVAGKFPPKSSPYLNNTAIRDQDGNALTGQSAIQWFAFCDPAVRAALAVAFLNGQRTPTIESASSSFDTLGMQYRGYHDFGVAFEDPKAAGRSDGTT